MGRHQRGLHMIAACALLVMFTYLIVRMVQTSAGANAIAFTVLLLAELMSLIATALYIYETWSVPEVSPPEHLAVSTDIVITTYDEPLTVIEPTIVGSLRVRGVSTVWVLDDGARDEVREFCDEVGARYVTREDNANAKAGNINNALPMISSELILLLDADHVPSRSIVERLSGYFRDPDVALVQSPHNFRNLDSMQHRSGSRHEQSLFFLVLQPARDRHDASFWCGSSALLRRSALVEIGGVATETVSEDMHTTVRLQRRGYQARYHNEVLATGLAPHTMADFLLQRYRWAQGTIQVLTSPESPLFGRGWEWQQRLHYLNNWIYYFLPFQRLAYVAVLLMVLLLGWLPVGSASLAFFVLLGVSVFLSNVASLGLARGMRDASEGISYTWLTAETYMRAVTFTLMGKAIPFKVTPKSLNALDLRTKLRLLRLPLVVILVVSAAWGLRAIEQSGGTLPFGVVLPGTLDALAFAAITAFVVLEIITVLPSVIRELTRTQQRSLWRFVVDLDGTAAGHPVTVKDVHETGISFVGAHGIADVGDDIPVEVAAVEDDDAPVIKGVMAVRRVIGHGPHSVYGGPVQWVSRTDHHSIVDLCYAQLSHVQGVAQLADDRRA